MTVRKRCLTPFRFIMWAMSTLRVSLLSLLLLSVLPSQPQAPSTLTVRIAGARSTRGKMLVALFQDARAFPDDAKALRRQTVEIDPKTLKAQAVFADLPPGIYAVALFHDENQNKRLDKNMLGMPKEGYGFSNNPRKKLGPPGFQEVSFALNQAAQLIDVGLIY